MSQFDLHLDKVLIFHQINIASEKATISVSILAQRFDTEKEINQELDCIENTAGLYLQRKNYCYQSHCYKS